MKTTQTVQCQNCNKWIDREQIEEHSKNHLPPSTLTPDPFNLVTPKRVDAVRLNLSVDDNPTQISSLLSDYLPSPLEERKKQTVPTRYVSSFSAAKQTGIFDPSKQPIPLKPDLNLDSEEFTLDVIETLTIEKQIDFMGTSASFSKNKMKPFENPNEVRYFMDNKAEPEKTNKRITEGGKDFDSMTEQSEHKYTLVPLEQENKGSSLTQQMVISRKLNAKSLCIHVDTKQQQKANNQSETKGIKVVKAPTTGTNFTDSGELSGAHTCRSCGGFYCQTCRSDIPARFRQPTPGPNEEDAQNFYSRMHQAQNCNRCNPARKIE